MTERSPASCPAIDIWCNPFTPEWLRRLYYETDELHEIVSWWGPRMEERTRGYAPQAFLSMLDTVGVGQVLVPAMQMMSYRTRRMNWDITPEDLVPLLSHAPGRLRGLVGLNPLHRMDGVRRLEHAVRDLGFKGAHIHSFGFGMSPGDKAFYPFYAKCVELDVPVVIQMGHSAEQMPSAFGRPLELDEVALYFPELRIVAAHTGWPWVEEMIAMAWKHPNVYVAMTAHAPRFWDASLVRFLNGRGKGKVMWGTDFPVVMPGESLEQVAALRIDDGARKLLLHDVAARVFGLEDGVPAAREEQEASR